MRPGWSFLQRCPLVDNVLDVVDVVTEQLADVTRPLVCPVCIYSLVATLGDPSHEVTVARMTRTRAQFWNACVAMVSAPGETGDLSSLRHVIDHNYLHCPNGKTHFTAHPCLGDTVAALINALTMCICLALEAVSKHETSLRPNYFAWPSSLSELIPYGPGPYVRWACVLPTHWSLFIISRLISTGQRDVIQQLLLTPNRERLAALVLRAFRQWDVADLFCSVPPGILEHDVPLRPMLRTERSAIKFYVVLALIRGPGRHHDDLGQLSDSLELQLHDALVDKASRSTDPLSGTSAILVEAASAISAYAGLPVHPLVRLFRETPCPRHAYESLSQPQAVYLYVMQRRESLLCSGPGCNAPAFDHGCPQTPCDLCNVTRYCSPSCQLLDWMTSRCGGSHQEVCPALRKFTEGGVLATDTTMSDFTDAYSNPSFLTHEEYRAITIWALTSGVLPTRFHSEVEGMLQVVKKEDDGEAAYTDTEASVRGF